ncbi:MAG TPA: recombination mediator RecR [bacterium]|nr:recombination mediator RecR [bacterium]HPV65547.1 recombination mediator RecR [bacterium]
MSIHYPKIIENLTQQLSKLPGVGRKTAERYVFYLIKQTPAQIRLLAKDLSGLAGSLKFCQKCLAISEKDICDICSDEKRSDKTLCVVANFQDMISIENTKNYNGKYFILDGLINTIENIGPEKLNLKKLVKLTNELIKKNKQIEIILALSPTIEGETTVLYLKRLLNSPKIKISKLAQGLSTGVNLEYVDEVTLSNALKYRNELK